MFDQREGFETTWNYQIWSFELSKHGDIYDIIQFKECYSRLTTHHYANSGGRIEDKLNFARAIFLQTMKHLGGLFFGFESKKILYSLEVETARTGQAVAPERTTWVRSEFDPTLGYELRGKAWAEFVSHQTGAMAKFFG